MTPIEALNILFQVTGKIPLVRDDMLKVDQALQVINAAIQPKPADVPQPPLA